MFDLEKAIKAWLKAFNKHKAFDPGAIREMELHLRDHIDDLLHEGFDEKTAFQKAVESFGDLKPMAKEVYSNQRPGTGKHSIINTTMLKNYFKITIRNFWRYKFYTSVNVLGLTIGLTTVFLIGLFVNDELTFDQFHENKNELYRVVENQYYAGQPVFPVAVTPRPLGPSLLEEYPEIVSFTRAITAEYQFEYKERRLMEDEGYLVDEGFFDMFSFKVVKGSTVGFGERLNALVLCEDMAQKYFPDVDPIGKSIKLNGKEFVVDAVMENVPRNSHLYFNYLVNYKNYEIQFPNRSANWGNNSLYTYVQLNEGASLEAVNEKIKGQIKKNNESSVIDIYLQPITDIYLGEVDFVVEVSRKGELIYVQIFSIVAVFILLISCINFMNLSTARASKRAKEVGLRKTIGAQRIQLIFQFLSESVLLSFVAVLLSVLLVSLVMPAFNQLTHKEFVFAELFLTDKALYLGIGILLAALVTGLLAGSYPAVYLSATNPISTLKAQSFSLKRGAGLRKVLVVIQFMISIVLIIGTLVIYNQVHYIQNIDLGYENDNVIYTSAPETQTHLLATALLNEPGVVDVGMTNRHPGYIMTSSSGFSWPNQNPDETMLIHYMAVDDRYMGAMKMNILEGRGFLPSDSAVMIVNEKALEVMEMEDPLGQIVTAFGERRIIGVVQDFNFRSIHTPIEPMFVILTDELDGVYVKYEEDYEDQIAATLENTWQEVFPDLDLSYYFLEQDFEQMYEAEQRTSLLSTCFAILAIIISCLGLFGLVSYAVEQRQKEIGIRKALGAPVSHLFILLTKDFTRLVVISLIISVPISWFIINGWLENFAYHISLSWWVYVVSALAAMGITLLTVSYQSIRASRANPVWALRNE